MGNQRWMHVYSTQRIGPILTEVSSVKSGVKKHSIILIEVHVSLLEKNRSTGYYEQNEE